MRLADVEVIIMHETDDAWLVKWDPDLEDVWIPKSVGELERIGSVGVLTLPENYALEKGMI